MDGSARDAPNCLAICAMINLRKKIEIRIHGAGLDLGFGFCPSKPYGRIRRRVFLGSGNDGPSTRTDPLAQGPNLLANQPNATFQPIGITNIRMESYPFMTDYCLAAMSP